MNRGSKSESAKSHIEGAAPGTQFGRSRQAGVLGELATPLGLGVLRLATEGRPHREQALALLRFAVQCGVRLFDTGDGYGLDENDNHYGDELLREVRAELPIETSAELRVTTKVGLRRSGRRWIPCGQPGHLRAAVEATLQALAVEQLDYLLLHARDPQTPFETTLGALADLQREGLAKHLGLCNTTRRDIEQAQRHFAVSLIQNELSVLRRNSATEGLLAWTQEQGIPFLAHRPLGGHSNTQRIAKSKVLRPLAERHGATPWQMAMAALLDSALHVLPIFGATKAEHIMSTIGSLGIILDVSDRTALSVAYSFQPDNDFLSQLPPAMAAGSGRPALPPQQGPGDDPEVVLLMGIQGAGKSELVRGYLEAGYARLNRDELGGKLDDLAPKLAALLSAGQRRVVLDNTYPTRTSRALVVSTAASFGTPVRCRFLNTPLVEAQKNIVLRMMSRYGVPLGPEEMKLHRKTDPNLPPPQALVRWLNSFEPPQLDEGFAVIDELTFQRRDSASHARKGLLLDVDGTLRKTLSGEYYPRHPDDLALLPGRRETLQSWVEDGYQLFLVSNQSGVASGKVSLTAMQACFLRTVQLLNLPVTEIAYCPHPAYPVGCFCRKPLPGLGVYLTERHQLDPNQLVMVGDMQSDEQFAHNLGATYYDADEFFE